jgi:hypothetical protein
MIGRKGPLLLEIIDLELEEADPYFSSYFQPRVVEYVL